MTHSFRPVSRSSREKLLKTKICNSIPKRNDPAGKPGGAKGDHSLSAPFFSPMESRAFKMMPKMAAPAMQGTFSPKKGMLPPKA